MAAIFKQHRVLSRVLVLWSILALLAHGSIAPDPQTPGIVQRAPQSDGKSPTADLTSGTTAPGIKCNFHQSMLSSDQSGIRTHQRDIKTEDCYDVLSHLVVEMNGVMVVRMNGTERRKSCGTCRLKFEMNSSEDSSASLEVVMLGTGKQRSGGMIALLSKCQRGGQIIVPPGTGLKGSLRIDVARTQTAVNCSPQASNTNTGQVNSNPTNPPSSKNPSASNNGQAINDITVAPNPKNPTADSTSSTARAGGVKCNFHQSMLPSDRTGIKTHQHGINPEDCYDVLSHLVVEMNGVMVVRMNGTERRKSCGTCRLKFEMNSSKNSSASLEVVMFGTGKQRSGGMIALLNKCANKGGQTIVPPGPGLKGSLRIDVAKAQTVVNCSPKASNANPGQNNRNSQTSNQKIPRIVT